MKNELEVWKELWERETAKTIDLLGCLPEDAYDYRPDPEARSLGEMAWHLAEGDGYGTLAIEKRAFVRGEKPPGIERPRTVKELRPAFERIHRDAAARIDKLKVEDLDRDMVFVDGNPTPIRRVMWDFILMHNIHHRGQLTMMCRQAGGRPVSIFGPTREQAPLRKPA